MDDRREGGHHRENQSASGEWQIMNPLDVLKRRMQRTLLAPVLEPNERLLQAQEKTLQRNSKALEQFAAAMSECAEQLAMHTDAVKGIASASQELLGVVREMNRILREVDVDEDRDGQGKRLIAENLSRRSGPPE
ncbi:MAG: hypothetical protein HYU85_01780 [Chloroflexi bacterium]|nr:hypothetical protein [Chloroflexota bacterium]